MAGENNALSEAMEALAAAQEQKTTAQQEAEAALRLVQQEKAVIAKAADDVVEAEGAKIRSELETQTQKVAGLPEKKSELDKMGATIDEMDKVLQDSEISNEIKKTLEIARTNLIKESRILKNEIQEVERVEKEGLPHWKTELPDELKGRMADAKKEQNRAQLIEKWGDEDYVRNLINNALNNDSEAGMELREAIVVSGFVTAAEAADRLRKISGVITEKQDELANNSADIYYKVIQDLGFEDLLEHIKKENGRRETYGEVRSNLKDKDFKPSNYPQIFDYAKDLRQFMDRQNQDSSVMEFGRQIIRTVELLKKIHLPKLVEFTEEVRIVEEKYNSAILKIGDKKRNYEGVKNKIHSLFATFSSINGTGLEQTINFLSKVTGNSDLGVRIVYEKEKIDEEGPTAFLEMVQEEVNQVIARLEALADEIIKMEKDYYEWTKSEEGQQLENNSLKSRYLSDFQLTVYEINKNPQYNGKWVRPAEQIKK